MEAPSIPFRVEGCAEAQRSAMIEKRRPADPIRRQDLARLLEDVSSRRTADAAARIFEAYAGRLYGLVYRILLDRQAAEDTVQDVFVALLEGKARYVRRP